MKARTLTLLLALACADPAPTRMLEIEPDSPATRGDLLTEAIGIETRGGEVTTILEPRCPLPCEERVTFGTYEDDQTEIVIYVFRGNSGRTEDSQALGVFEIAGLPPGSAGEQDVVVTFRASKQGIALLAEEIPGVPIELRAANPQAF